MRLDWVVFDANQVDEYAFDYRVPKHLIEEVSFETADGVTLAGVWLRQEEPRPPLVFFHGQANHLDGFANRLSVMYKWGAYDIFAFDYRGFGRSQGVPTEEGVFEFDGEAAVAYVVQQTGVPAHEIVWYGHSLGGGVALHTSQTFDTKAIIVESTYSSVDGMIQSTLGLSLPQSWFVNGEYDNLAAAAQVRAPTLFIHGLRDDYVPPEHVLSLYGVAPEPKELWRPEEVGHDDIWKTARKEWKQKALSWFGSDQL